MTVPLSRRAFLKWSGVLAIGATQLTFPHAGQLRIASTWPLTQPHQYLPNPDSLFNRDLTSFDLLLVPAYVAAELIQRGALQALSGSPGRAHDPEGAFTQFHHSETIRLPLASAWPDHPRLVVGAALWARGYSPNDSHPGHLAQIEKDVLARRLPARSDTAALLIEYDWVIPQGARRDLSLEFLRYQHSPTPAIPQSAQHPAIPLMPLPHAARAQMAQWWTRLTTNG
jgi:hypothetical protein